jgi:Tol biopolymer transport system component
VGCQPELLQSSIPTRASPLQTPPSPTAEVEPTAASDTWPTLTPPPTPLPPPPRTPVIKPSPTPKLLPTRPPIKLSPTPVGSPPADLQSLYYVADSNGKPELRVIRIDAQGKKWAETVTSVNLVAGTLEPAALYPSPDGKYLAIQISGMAAPLLILERSSGRSWCPLGKPEEKCSGSFSSWMLNNRLLFQPGIDLQSGGALIINIDTGEYKQLSLPLSPERAYSFVSNISLNLGGARFAYSVTYPENGKEISEIWTMGMDGQDKRLMRKVEGGITTLSWSPTGKQLVYLYQPGTRRPSTDPYELWLLNSDGSGERLLARGQCYGPTWSLDGLHVAFVQVDNPDLYFSDWRGPGTNIYVADTTTGQITRLSSFERRNNHSPTWSPDGKFVAFVSIIPVGEPGMYDPGLVYGEVWIASVDGKQLYAVSGTARWPGALAWLPSELTTQEK